MMRAFIVVVVSFIVSSASSCLLGELTGIPCGRDDECATAHFCDLTIGSCVQETDLVTAPNLQVTGVRGPDGAVVRDPIVEATGLQGLAMVVENIGLLPALDVVAEFTELRCLSLEIDESTVPDTIVPGGGAEVKFFISPERCGTPMIVDWFMFFSGRGSRGTFNLNIRAAPPSAT